MEQNEVIEIVRKHLQRHQPDDYHLEVIPEASWQSEGWWYVAVGPDRQDIRRYDYYDIMAQVEREIEDELEANITLVPPPSLASSPA